MPEERPPVWLTVVCVGLALASLAFMVVVYRQAGRAVTEPPVTSPEGAPEPVVPDPPPVDPEPAPDAPVEPDAAPEPVVDVEPEPVGEVAE